MRGLLILITLLITNIVRIQAQQTKSFIFVERNVSFVSSPSDDIIRIKDSPLIRYFKPGYSMCWGVEYQFRKILSIGGAMGYSKTTSVFNSDCLECNPPEITNRNTLKMNSFLVPLFIKIRTNRLPRVYLTTGVGVSLLFYSRVKEAREYVIPDCGEQILIDLGEREVEIKTDKESLIGNLFWTGLGYTFKINNRPFFTELYYFNGINFWKFSANIPFKRYGVSFRVGMYLGK